MCEDMIYKERLLEQGLSSLEKTRGGNLAVVSLHERQHTEDGSEKYIAEVFVHSPFIRGVPVQYIGLT